MIKRVVGGYQVFDSKGDRALSKPGLTRKQAENRLAQIEHYKKTHAASAKGEKK